MKLRPVLLAMLSGAIILALAGPAASLQAQSAKSTLDGIYTVEQAERGRTAYSEDCMECHGRYLEGDVETRPLAGYLFTNSWVGNSMQTLFDRVRITMPADKAGTLSRQRVADILAFVLQVNEFPAGKTELSTKGEILQQIRFDLPKDQK